MGDVDFDTPVPTIGADGKKRTLDRDYEAMIPRHRSASFFHLFFKAAAIVSYLLCTLLSSSFIIAFLVVVLLLVADFWTVKNVTGRLLVGLRWWNDVDSQGNTQWKFESRASLGATVNKADSRVFWVGMYGNMLVWLVFSVTAFLRFNFSWLLLVFVAIVLNAANIYGYNKSENDAAKQVQGFAQRYLFSKLTGGSGAKAAVAAVSNV